ncbi:MAG: CaiB/BaiF CoA-transferase family protein [Fluviicola sp.]|nr:CaiB/BaiF CoA-transferase family protein [Fluviicola sp.]
MFESLKVIELATVLAGPAVGMFFAELGAEVIKIEHPSLPDVTRSWKLPSENDQDTVSAYFSSVNYRKQYRKMDLTSAEGVSEIRSLIQTADILLLNFKKGDDLKFGLTSTEIWKLNPRIIIGKITGFGDDSDRVAYDLILQAESGLMSMNGTPESGPVKMPVAFIDVLAAHQLKEGLLVALIERLTSRKGQEVSVSLYDTAVSSLVNQASNYLMEGHVPQRIGSLHPNIAPYGELFTTTDHKQVTFAIGSNRHFEGLCTFLGLPELVSDERFSDNAYRVKNRTALFGILQTAIAQHTSGRLNFAMQEQHIPFGIIRSLDEVFTDPMAQSLVRTEQIAGKTTQRVTSIAFKRHGN